MCDMNITLSVDDRVVQRARKTAEGLGMSLNQAVRSFLEQLAGDDQLEKDIAELAELSASSGGDARGWRFDRNEIHERRS